MLRSLFSAISGLRVNQTMLDVTGNNIANANTAGYKSSQTVFQDTLSQMLTGGSAPAAQQGGTNPMQIGLGVQVGAISTNLNQGAPQMTGQMTDLMIQGDGLFIVSRGGEDLYTRAGSFNFDAAGRLVNADGDVVQGFQADAAGNVNTAGAPGDIVIPELATEDPANPLRSYSIGPDGTITGVFDDGAQRALGQIALANFANPVGLEKVGDTLFREGVNSGVPQIGAAGTGARGNLLTGSLEMSNVDLAQEFTNLIVAQRGFQANSRVITTSDQVLEDLVNIKR
ncbi:MAG TPA: flagellar hook-basal body complex protein [Nocardioidaceae bacterium]|nr:flagellar hook-basal body complex protein [Nocardioidaceae bacterium]